MKSICLFKQLFLSNWLKDIIICFLLSNKHYFISDYLNIYLVTILVSSMFLVHWSFFFFFFYSTFFFLTYILNFRYFQNFSFLSISLGNEIKVLQKHIFPKNWSFIKWSFVYCENFISHWAKLFFIYRRLVDRIIHSNALFFLLSYHFERTDIDQIG